MKWAELLDRILSAAYPQRCVLCGEVVAYDDYWCGKCEFVRIGRMQNVPAGALAGVLAVAEYSGPMRSVVWRLKNGADKRCLGFLGEEMFGVLEKHWSGIGFDLVVPVPTSPSRLEARGFNQAELLAGEISRKKEIPMLRDALLRREDSQTQHDLTAVERKINADASFDVFRAQDVAGKTVLFVDDVITTGATLAACAVQLERAGAASLYALTAAATPLSTADAEKPGSS